MKISVTGHTSGLGRAIYGKWADNSIGFSRTNGYDINDPECRRRIIEESSNSDIFVNCAHSGMSQVYLLYDLRNAWINTNKLIINISSNSSDGIKRYSHVYAVEKFALDKASEQLSRLPDSCRIVNLRLGYIDVQRIDHLTDAKISTNDVVTLVDFVINQPSSMHIHEITVLPR